MHTYFFSIIEGFNTALISSFKKKKHFNTFNTTISAEEFISTFPGLRRERSQLHHLPFVCESTQS